MSYLRYCCLFIMALLMPLGQVLAQAYGLRFLSHEVDQDRRTGLDLSHGQLICTGGEYALSFEMSFRPGQLSYYGYVFRMVDTNGRSIDLICDSSTPNAQHFQLVINERSSKIAFTIPNRQLFGKWNKLRFKFDTHVGSVNFTHGRNTLTDRIPIAGRGCMRLYFGANNLKGFGVNDVPPMDIRHICIDNSGDNILNWPLDEAGGQQAYEKQRACHGWATNAEWIKRMHRDWQQVASLTVKGNASVSFDELKSVIYIAGQDSLFAYDPARQRMRSAAYASGGHKVMPGNQSVWVNRADSGAMLNYYPDQKAVALLKPGNNRWSNSFLYPDTASDYWHTNKFYSAADSSLYILGGYGHFKYRNSIIKYDLNTSQWEKLSTGGDFFTPRYLASLGRADSGAYILGGYGSAQGRQTLGAKNLYDLMYYNTRSNSFKKIYEFSPQTDFAFANSMIVDEKNDTFYALAFDNHKYRTRLQLMKGALSRPGYLMVGNSIPYLFHDIESFADLYYSASSGKFYAVVLLARNNSTSVNIYSLLGPPLASTTVELAAVHTKGAGWLTLIFIVLGILALVMLIWLRVRKAASDEPLSAGNNITISSEVEPVIVLADKQGSISLFGDLKIIDADGNEITRFFTPLLKELFLLLFLYSARWGRSISSEKLREFLWFDKNEESARNNRSVTIARLKTLLEKLPGCQITKEAGSWKMNIDTALVQADYMDYLAIMNDKQILDKDKLNKLAHIIQRGCFLADTEYQWLDAFKSEVSNNIIDTYLHYAADMQIEDDPEFLVRISSYITYFDPVNEDAMRVRCKALSYLGKHSLAKQVYTDFKREYAHIYGIDFIPDFQHVLSGYQV